ncbi:FkbM family methyltransferase [Butyrivibrio sp.]|uniref:FkbM family methyltransferase n=1 Tax=Butyrivibrio sp. TaxID=28121 RepID=UPI0025C737DF|nr:FkbM family methyltransferase [Butyrivibrio sp.]MBQ9301571.1 FkbM family methyltransferase [Butyrivibrio sp.]
MDKFMYETEDSIMLKSIYDHLQDEESIEIYNARSLFSLSDDKRYLDDVINKMSLSKELFDFLDVNNDKKRILFGAGTWGKAILEHIKIKWDHVVDNKRAGMTINEYTIKRIEDLDGIENCIVVLAILFKYKEVLDQLLNMGIKKENILVLGELATRMQYFDLEQLRLGSEEVYVDVGGFNGDTALRFNQVVGGRYKHIYVFEPNRQLFQATKENLQELHDCKVFNNAVWSKRCSLELLEAGEGTRVSENSSAGCEIQAVSIDEVICEEIASFIKMDIEGSEYEALKGAIQTITNYKPKLAISVYHKRDDIWEIPKLLLKLNPDYRFYLRIYSFTGNDTVLYAI